MSSSGLGIKSVSNSELLCRNDEEFRDPHEVVSCWQDGGAVDRRMLEYHVEGCWWEILGMLKMTLLVSREYEHLLMALRVDERAGPDVSFIRIPHPSGIAVSQTRGSVHVASTRNPNQIFDFVPIDSLMPRLDCMPDDLLDRPLVPVRTRIMPGCLYIHEMALVGGHLHVNSVGQNAIVRLDDTGSFTRVWWPKCIESDAGPIFDRNQIQLNSIAAGSSLSNSFFSASTDKISELRPGNPAFPMNKRGVIFSGESREPIVRGLTRPHSARLWRGVLWVDNSGYGEIGIVERETFQTVCKMPGWTRGLCFKGDYAFVGTSRILPRFRAYAPGLEPDDSVCGIHIFNLSTGKREGSLIWPYGNQIFSVEWTDSSFTSGFPFRIGRDLHQIDRKTLFYAFNAPEPEKP